MAGNAERVRERYRDGKEEGGQRRPGMRGWRFTKRIIV